jgi:hypothetical protein
VGSESGVEKEDDGRLLLPLGVLVAVEGTQGTIKPPSLPLPYPGGIAGCIIPLISNSPLFSSLHHVSLSHFFSPCLPLSTNHARFCWHFTSLGDVGVADVSATSPRERFMFRDATTLYSFLCPGPLSSFDDCGGKIIGSARIRREILIFRDFTDFCIIK